MTRPILLTLVLLTIASHAEGQDKTKTPLAGFWQGTLKAGPINLRLSFHLVLKEDKYHGKLDSPDQGAFGLPLSAINVKDDTVELVLKDLGARYEGKLAKDGKTLEGDFHQSGLKMPLTLKRMDKAPDYARPQDPKKPYPYHEEEVTFENEKAKATLAGTLTLPKGAGPFPVVVMISGSGPQDRNEALMGHRPFLIWADHLTRQGIAVLRFDDRGVGKSTGKFWDATTFDHASDVQAGVQFLKSRKEIDGKRIGLIGHSEGALVAPLVAKEDASIAFIVLLAGPGLTGEQIIETQTIKLPKMLGVRDKEIERNVQLQRKIAAVLKDEADSKKALERMKGLIDDFLKDIEKTDPKSVDTVRKTVEAQLQPITFKWLRAFMAHDPRPVLKKVACPVLAINGENDVQVEARPNLAEIGKALIEGGNKDITLKEFAGLNHLFQRSKTGAISEYGVLQTTIEPEVMEFVSSWIRQRTERTPAK